MNVCYLKLRANIELDGDLTLAVREANGLFEKIIVVAKQNLKEARKDFPLPETYYSAHTREKETIGFLGVNPKIGIFEIAKQLSFIQEVWLEENQAKEVVRDIFVSSTDGFVCAVPFLAMSEFLTYANFDRPNTEFIQEVLRVLTLKTENAKISRLVSRANTSAPHVHGLHTYKAKFFPRFVRSLIVSETRLENRGEQIILDPFVGSGTAAVEAALLGFRSIGIDIDKLSCLIAESKINLLENSFDFLQKSVLEFYGNETSPNGGYNLPSWMRRKFERKGNLEEKQYYEKQITDWIERINSLNGNRSCFQIAVSDALARKFNVRMMGTGVGRFALEIQKTSIDRLVEQNIKFALKCSQIVGLLKNVYRIKIEKPNFINGTATKIDLADESVDFIITSPPYLPASSGRENYLIGKSISLTALGLLSEEEIGLAEKQSVGSMKNQNGSSDGLPDAVHELHDWLFKDELRNIKAQPTLAYYQDLKKSLKESFRVLKRGGKAVFIIGKETVFYTSKTREVLYRVSCDKIFKDIAQANGFHIVEAIDIELDKKNKNARPRSLDKFFETAIILQKI